MKLRKILLILLALSLLLTLTMVGAVFAYMYRQTETVTNNLIPANVGCEVVEAFDGSKKTSIAVKNTGNIDAYLRVRLVTYWVNDDGEIMPVSSAMPSYEIDSEHWISGSNHTYYYKSPIVPGATTPENLLPSGIMLGISTEGYKQVIEVFAEAIQAKPADAVTSAWGVTVNADGTVKAVS